MNYFLLIIILFTSPGQVKDIIHLDTIKGKQNCLNIMSRSTETKQYAGVKIPRGSVISCVPLRIKEQKI